MTISSWIGFILLALCVLGLGIFIFWLFLDDDKPIAGAILANGLNRHITIYTADGNVIAEYEGKIDLEDNQGGYVLFDYEGKRYTYYNCFVESIAEIGGN